MIIDYQENKIVNCQKTDQNSQIGLSKILPTISKKKTY